METSPLISSANQWTGFYMIKASVMKKLSKNDNNALRLLGKTAYEKVKNLSKIKYLYN